MRVLFLTQYFLPQPLANAEVIGGLAVALAAKGHDVHVVSGAKHASAPGVTAHRAPTYFARDRASIPMRMLEYASFSLSGLIASMLVPRPEVIVVPSPPPSLGVIGVLIGALRRAPVVYNVQDLYPEVAVAATRSGRSSLSRLLGSVMRWVYRRCSAIIVIDERFVDVVREAAGHSRVRAVRNGIDLAPFANATSLREELGIDASEVVLMYAGNVGRSQDLRPVAAAAAAVGARFVVHGDGAGLEALRQHVVDRGLQDTVCFSGFRPREDIGRVFATADVHIVPLKAGIAHASVPSKLLSIFAAGRPAIVVAEADSAAADVLREASGGWLVEPGDNDELLSAIGTAVADRQARETYGESARAWAIQRASTERAADEYEAVLAGLRA